jgi:hypothetical protein
VVVVVGSFVVVDVLGGWFVELVVDVLVEVDVDVLVVVGGSVVVVVDVGGSVVLVVVELVEVDVDVLVVVGGSVVVVVDVEVVVELVGGSVVVVVLEVDVDDSVVLDDVDVGDSTTGIVMSVSVGIAHVTAAVSPMLSCTLVVSWNAFSVMSEPAAPAVASTVTSGVVRVPGTNGPGGPNVILSGAVRLASNGIVCVAPPAVGTSVAVPGFTIVPVPNVVPWICRVWATFR